MRVYLIIFIFFGLNFSLYGSELKPCQKVDFDQVAKYTFPKYGWIGSKEKEKIIQLLKKCLYTSEVCIIEAEHPSEEWFSDKLKEPVDGDFGLGEGRLVLGLLQYEDKKDGSSVCIVAKNSFAHAVPWIGASWIISKENITEYEIGGVDFTTVMTPNSLYKALLKAHKNEVEDAQRDEMKGRKP